jgi:hypothetical protein
VTVNTITVTLDFGILGLIFTLKNSKSPTTNTICRRGIILMGDGRLELPTSAL